MAKYLFTSERLGFRDWTESDLEPMTAINQDPRVMEYFPALQDREKTAEFMGHQRRCLKAEGCCFFATDLLETQEMIGFVGFKPVRFAAFFTPCVEIGWRLAFDQWGRGLATEAAQANLSFAFDKIGLEKLYSFTTLENRRSERVMQKIGMNPLEGFNHPLLPDGHPLRRHVLYEIQRHP